MQGSQLHCTSHEYLSAHKPTKYLHKRKHKKWDTNSEYVVQGLIVIKVESVKMMQKQIRMIWPILSKNYRAQAII